MTEQLIVELILDRSNLDSSLAQLQKSGQIDKATADAFKATTDQIRAQAAEAKKAATAFKPLTKNLDDLGKATKNLGESFLQGVQEGLTDALEEAGVSAEEFAAALEGIDNGGTFKSLKQELRETAQALAQMKVDGTDVGPVYDALVARAGELRDAMDDANAAIRDAGSDTKGLDNLLGSAQAVAGGFAVVQGAVGIFGDESEELQKTLLRVNSAMAVLQGLQQIQNALQKEGALTLLAANAQRKIQNAQIILNTGAESANVVVKYASIAAQRLLNAVMAANPIALFVSALVIATSAIAAYVISSRKAEEQTAKLNAALDEATEGFQAYATRIKQENDRIVSEMQDGGARQSAIQEQNLKTDREINKKRSEEIARLRQILTESRDVDEEEVAAANARLKELAEERTQADYDEMVKANELKAQLREEDLQNAVAVAERRALLVAEGTPAQLAAQKAAIAARLALELNAEGLLEGERARLITQAQKERDQLDSDYRKRRLTTQAAQIENELILVREGTEEEYVLRRRLLEAQNKIELENLQLSEAERLRIREKGNKEIALLDRNFSEAERRRAIENEISKNQAVIAQIKTNEEDRLDLSIANISYQAQLEVDAALGNADKIKEINAKRDADILALRRQFIEQAAAYEAELLAVDDAPTRRALEKRLNGQVAASLASKKAAINQLRDMDVAAIDEQIKTQDELYAQRLISDKEYELNRAKLLDERVKANEDAEQQITETTKQANIERANLILQTTAQVTGLLGQLAGIQAESENAEMERRRNQLEELQEAGAITERDAIARAKRLDAEERAMKMRQAQREKALAIFDAVLNTAQAVTNAISTGDPYTMALRAAIAAGIGAAQIAVISSRPLPQFATGKTSLYEGMAEVGETGAAEIVERNGRMYVVDKPTITYLGKHDKVYTPHETKKIMASAHKVDKEVVNYKYAPPAPQQDMGKLAKAIGKEIAKIPGMSVNIDSDGFTTNVRKGIDNYNYWSQRFKF